MNIRDRVCYEAQRSFDYLANDVLSSALDAEICRDVQDLIEDKEDFVLRTPKPRALAAAIYAWLSSRCVMVMSTTVSLPQSELLAWLHVTDIPQSTDGVSLEVSKNAVELKWL